MTRNTELTRTALYRLALQRFGPDAQALKLTEEAAETGGQCRPQPERTGQRK
ncbi:hypothetical protein L960_1888c [Escherichia coli B7A]|nr:hypothetical protein L960_1888c [Escherichia coli B7A]